jgi:hypothetical protein
VRRDANIDELGGCIMKNRKLPHRRQFLHLAAVLPAVSRAATWGRSIDYFGS